jgi:hypothetical protein
MRSLPDGTLGEPVSIVMRAERSCRCFERIRHKPVCNVHLAHQDLQGPPKIHDPFVEARATAPVSGGRVFAIVWPHLSKNVSMEEPWYLDKIVCLTSCLCLGS